MPALSINGVELPVAQDSFSLSFEDVGADSRNTRGHRVLERRRSKWVFDFTLSLLPLAEAMMFRSLILGDGEFWSTLTSAFGAKGLPLTGTGGWSGISGGNPFSFNGVWRLNAGQTLVIPGNLYGQSALTTSAAGRSGLTAVGWRRDDGAGTWRIFGFSWPWDHGVVFVSRQKQGALGASGVAEAYSGGETFLGVGGGAGTMQITAPGSGGPWSWSNIMLLPWFLPLAQVDQLMNGFALLNSPIPQVPRVFVTSDLLPNSQLSGGGASLICHGKISDIVVTPAAINGVWDPTACMLSGTLIEV